MFGDAPIAELRGGLPTMTPDGHFIVDRLPGTGGLYVASGCNVGGLSISPPIGEDLAGWIVAGGERPRTLETLRIDRFDDRYEDEERAARGLLPDVRAQVRQGRGGGPATGRRRHRGESRHEARSIDPAAARPRAAQVPIFSRTATGLVRQVSLFQQIVFNLASSNALGQGLVFFLSVVVLFPRANIYIALLDRRGHELLRVDDVRAAQRRRSRASAATTRSTRACCRPGSRSAATSASFMGGLFGVPIFGYFMATLALSPALAVIGGVTGSSTLDQVERLLRDRPQDRRVHHDARRDRDHERARLPRHAARA